MIKLTKIKMEGKFISARVEVEEEGPSVYFYIKVDFINHKIVKNTRGKMDMYVSHARTKLFQLAETFSPDDVPETAVAAWY